MPGEGSVFTLILPVSPQAAAPAPLPPIEGLSGQQPEGPAAPDALATVLVTDDDAASRRIIGAHLAREGYRVIYAASGLEALEKARAERPDAITLDIMMPQVDGWSVLRELKADPELGTIPVVLLSMVADRGLGFALGAAAVLTKPVDRTALAAALRDHMGRDGAAAPVLVIEDDVAARLSIERALDKLGLRPVLTAHGREALDWLEANEPPRLILLDLMMPVMDGFEFLGHLRKRPDWGDIPVLVLTAKSLTGEERQVLAEKAQRIVTKGRDAQLALSDAVRDAIMPATKED